MVFGAHDECPACGTPVAGDGWCGICGLELRGSEADALRSLAAQLAAAEAELNVVWARRDTLAKQLASRRWERGMNAATIAPPPRPDPPFARPASAPPASEWSTERVRDVFLWTGATLLALSALAFTAVAWTHLGPTGRAALLVAITVLTAAGATATRARLPATSGALTGLAIALALIDWQVARRAGAADGLSGAEWWAIGTAVVAVASLGLGRIASPKPAHRAVAILAPTSAVLALASAASSAWSGALGLALLAAALVGLDRLDRRRARDPVVRALLRIEACLGWAVGAVFAIIAAFEAYTVAQSLTPAAVMLALALAPGLVLVRPTAAAGTRVSMASLVFAACLGAVLTVAASLVGPIGLLTLAVILGCSAVAIAPSRAEVGRRAAHVVGVVAAAPGIVYAGVAAMIAELGPTAWLGHAWTGTLTAKAADVVAGPHTSPMPELGWCAVAILASAAVAIPFAVRPAGGAQARADAPGWRVVAAGVGILSIVLVPIAGGFSALVAFLVVTGGLVAAVLGAALAARDRPERALPYGFLAMVPALPALGWAALTPSASITALASVAAAAFIATAAGRSPSLRAAHAALGAAATATFGAVVALAAGASVQTAGFVGGTVAGVLLVVGSLARRDATDGIALEIVGGLGILGGAALASPSAAWLAGTLTAAVPLLFAARLRGHRPTLYAWAGSAAALGATWAWLAAANVTVVEAYTLPAAAWALVAGGLTHKEGPARSWLNYGPALVLLLGPTLVLAIARNDDTRAILVGLAALAVLLVGARERLQAPITLGALTLVALGVDRLGPVAVRLPRWVMLAFAGSLLLWVGTTFERRREGAQRAARRFERLG